MPFVSGQTRGGNLRFVLWGQDLQPEAVIVHIA
jgi:hypothetical protein